MNKSLVAVSNIELLSKKMAEEIFVSLEAKEEELGLEGVKKLTSTIIAMISGALVLKALKSEPPGLSKQQLFEKSKTNFLNIKVQLQDALALGFSAALSSYSGQQCEYYCQVKVVPPPVNTKPC